MAIFKVTRHDKPSLKKLVKAETVTELIDAKTKLSLTDITYKIFMEDLTKIDGDAILQELVSTSKEQLMLILVPDGIDWDGSIMTKNKPDVLEVTENPERIPQPDYMANDLKDTSLTMAKKMSHRIVNNYSASFTVKIGGFTLEGAGASLGQKLYDRINYVKQDHNGSGASQSYTSEDLQEPTKKPKAQDEYGCVAYSPELPENETWESQEEKRLELMDYYKSSEAVESVTQLMADSYCLQRKRINKEKDLDKFFANWPYFTNYKIIIALEIYFECNCGCSVVTLVRHALMHRQSTVTASRGFR